MSENVSPALPRETATMREITFSVGGHACRLSIEPAGDPAVPSVFLVGLPKAGSTLLNLTLRPLLKSAGLTYVNLQGAMNELGVPPRNYPPELNAAFQPAGYAFGGFRSLPGPSSILPSYASGRTILLIRDPRDMLSSLFFSVAFSHSPPGAGLGGALARRFDKSRDEARTIGIDAFALANVKTVTQQFAWVEKKLAPLAYRFYRYEDIIFDKLNWTRATCCLIWVWRWTKSAWRRSWPARTSSRPRRTSAATCARSRPAITWKSCGPRRSSD